MDAINVKIDKENVWNTQIVLKLANSGRKQYHSVMLHSNFRRFVMAHTRILNVNKSDCSSTRLNWTFFIDSIFNNHLLGSQKWTKIASVDRVYNESNNGPWRNRNLVLKIKVWFIELLILYTYIHQAGEWLSMEKE